MRPRNAIIVAAVVWFVVGSWLPLGREALYPLELFSTWVHEMGHGITALAIGGRFDSLEIFKDGSGLAQAFAWPASHHAVVALGGLLAPPIVGALLLAVVHGPRRARVALTLLAAGLVVSLALYVRSPAGVIAMPLCAALFGYVAWFAFAEHPERRVVAVQILAVVLAINTLVDMTWYVFQSSVEIDGVQRKSDIGMVADGLGGPYWMWGAAVTAFAVAMLALGLWRAWSRPEPVAQGSRLRRDSSARRRPSSRSKPESLGS